MNNCIFMIDNLVWTWEDEHIDGTKEEDKTVQKEAAGSPPAADRAGFNCGGRLRGSQLTYTGGKAQGRGKSSCHDRSAEICEGEEGESQGKGRDAKAETQEGGTYSEAKRLSRQRSRTAGKK